MDLVLLNVLDEKIANSVWTYLGSVYQAKSPMNNFLIRKKSYSIRMEEGGSSIDHLNAFNFLIAQLTSSSVKIEEEDRCITLLCSLSDSLDHLVMALSSTSVTFKMDDVVYSLLFEGTQRKSSDLAKEDLVVPGRFNDRGKKYDNKYGKGRSKSHGKSKTPRKSKEKCRNCDKTGHFCKDYKDPKKKKKASVLGSKKYQEDGDAFIVAFAWHASDNLWLVDLGASFHMTSHRSWFSKYEVFDGGKVYLGDDSHLNIVG